MHSKLYFISLLFLLPTICMGQNEVDSFITQLKSGDALAVQGGKDSIIRRWFYIYADRPNDSETKRFEKELIKIIESDTTLADTVLAHTQAAEKISEQSNARQLFLSDDKTAAIFLVGTLKIKNAIPVLVKHINYVTPGQRTPNTIYSFFEAHLDYYPSAIALIIMNDTTCVPQLVDVVKKHPDSGTRFIASHVIFRLEADKKDNNSLHQAFNQSTDSTERKRLQDGISRRFEGKLIE